MKAVIIGNGKMGHLISETLKKAGDEVLAMGDILQPETVVEALPDADVIFDFSHPDNASWILKLADEHKVPLVEGTTALSEETRSLLEQTAENLPVFFTSNYSLGIAVLRKLAAEASRILKNDWDIEILEKHHNQKADAPSGTALMLLDAMDPDQEFDHVLGRTPQSGKRKPREIGVSAMRGGTLAGYHEIDFEGPDESLTLSHNAANRQIFVNGAIRAARFLLSQKPGLYDMDDLIASAS